MKESKMSWTEVALTTLIGAVFVSLFALIALGMPWLEANRPELYSQIITWSKIASGVVLFLVVSFILGVVVRIEFMGE